MAGPTTDFGYTIFGANTGTPGYVTESALTAAQCDTNGNCTYSFTNVDSRQVGGNLRHRRRGAAYGDRAGWNHFVADPVQYGAFNPVSYFSVDGSPVETRRTIVQMTNCNTLPRGAGGTRDACGSNVQYCVFCHNPSNTDATTRATATVAADKAAPPQGINFNLLAHRIHDGVNVTARRRAALHCCRLRGKSQRLFPGVLFPGLSPTGRRNKPPRIAHSAMSTVQSKADLSLTGLHVVTDPQGLINPVQPFSSACSGCHVDIPSASHFLSNSNSLGESCAVCHGTGGAFSVDSVHAQF